MKPTTVMFAAMLLCLPLAARADGPAIGPNGGQVRDAGKYHLELVVKDTALSVYVTGSKDAKVSTKGASGSATVLAGLQLSQPLPHGAAMLERGSHDGTDAQDVRLAD